MMLAPTTSKVFNDDTFGMMKKGPWLSNDARECVNHEDALITELVVYLLLLWKALPSHAAILATEPMGVCIQTTLCHN